MNHIATVEFVFPGAIVDHSMVKMTKFPGTNQAPDLLAAWLNDCLEILRRPGTSLMLSSPGVMKIIV